MIIDIPEYAGDWHALRSKNIGSSEVAALFGAAPAYALSLYALHHVKAGDIPAPFKGNERVTWGKRLEAVIAQGVAEQEGWTLKPGVYATDDQCAGMASTLDAVIAEPSPKDHGCSGPGVLEIKSTDYAVWKHSWTNGEPPVHVLLQHQHEMACTGYTWGAVGSFVGGNTLTVYRYKADLKMQAAIRRKVTQFWANVRAGKEPDVDASDATAAALRALYPEVIDESLDLSESNEWPDACAELLRLSDERRRLEADEAEAKARVTALLAGHKRGWGCGFAASVSVTPAKPDRPAREGEIITGRSESRTLRVKEMELVK